MARTVRTRRRNRWAVAVACVATIATLTEGTAVRAAQSRVPLGGTAIDLHPEHVQDNGPAPADLRIDNRVHLSVRDPAALSRLAMEVSTPGSHRYGQYLSTDRIRRMNEIRPARLAAVRTWLASAGLTVSRSDWRSLDVSGTAAQFNAAFGTTLHTYQTRAAVPYHFVMPASNLTVPAGLSDVVLGVSTIIWEYRPPTPTRKAAAAKAADPRTAPAPKEATDTQAAAQADPMCSAYWGEKTAVELPPAHGRSAPWAPCGYTPTQLRRAYGIDDARLTGAGQVVAVLMETADTLEEDVNTWSARVGTPPLRPGQLRRISTVDGSPPPPPGIGSIEGTMDVEAVHGMAPAADIIAIGGSTRPQISLLDLMAYAIDHTDATIVSASVAQDPPPGMQTAYEQIEQQGALHGVGFYFSSGDGGADPAGNFLNKLAVSPWVTGVGGTSLAIGTDDSRLWETGWGNAVSRLNADRTAWQALPGDADHGAGGGGGQTVGRAQPWYQRGVVPDALAMGTDGRRYRIGADVAMNADSVTGMIVGGKALNAATGADPRTWTYVERRYGGTSLSTPLFAGVQALAQQVRGKPIGFANPALYRRAGGAGLRDVVKHTFTDGTAPVVAVQRDAARDPQLFSLLGRMPYGDAQPPTPDTTPGFDTVTGVGTPTGAYPWSYTVLPVTSG